MSQNRKEIACIDESSLTIKNVFLSLFNCRGKAVYVKNQSGVAGVISPTDFIKYYVEKKEGSYKYNTSYKYIWFAPSEKEMLKEAEKIFRAYGIRGSVPVKLDDTSVYGEITEADHIDLEEHKKQFEYYENSLYMREEAAVLKKMLISQRIIVIGNKKQFMERLGFLFSEDSQVIFAGDKIEDYEMIMESSCLIVDVTDGYPLRRELYRRMENGYMWDDFLIYLERQVKRKKLKPYAFLLELSKEHDFVKFLKNYFLYIIYDYRQEIEVALILKALTLADVRVELKTNLIKKECVFSYQIRGKNRVGEYELQVILWFYTREREWKDINKQYGNLILHYCVGTELHFLDNERNAMESVEFKNLIQHKWIPVLPMLRDDPEGDKQRFTDYCADGFTYENGLRKTLYQPEFYCGTIYCVGLCNVYGAFVKDEDTVSVLMQKELNKRHIPYRVVNLGYLIESDLKLDRIKLEVQDVIVILHSDFYEFFDKKQSYIDISSRLEKLHTETFFSTCCRISILPGAGRLQKACCRRFWMP